MSKATKRKHVAREVLDDFVVPDENQQIVKVLGGRGNNLHEAESPEGKTFLVSMPTKFRKNVWIKRGDFVVVEPIEEGHKVCAEIVHILYAKQVKYLKKENLWPSAFSDKLQEDQLANQDDKENFSKPRDDSIPSDEKDSSDEDDDSDLFVNTNRMTFVTNVESESESECDEDDDDDENCKQGEIFC